MPALKEVSRERIEAFQKLYKSLVGRDISYKDAEAEITLLSELIFDCLHS